MKSSPTIKRTAVGTSHPPLLAKEVNESQKILHRTFGIWRGRQLDPVAYQRKMRASYGTVRRKSK